MKTEKYIVVAREINGPSASIISAHGSQEEAEAAARMAVPRRDDGYGYKVEPDYRVTESLWASDLAAGSN